MKKVGIMVDMCMHGRIQRVPVLNPLSQKFLSNSQKFNKNAYKQIFDAILKAFFCNPPSLEQILDTPLCIWHIASIFFNLFIQFGFTGLLVFKLTIAYEDV
jgi:hypothetical protein